MADEERRPFVFGVSYLLDESGLESLLHKQFGSDDELAAYVKALGYEINFDNPSVTIDSGTGVIAKNVGLSKNGGVGALELIDKGDVDKVAGLIEEAKQELSRGTGWFENLV